MVRAQLLTNDFSAACTKAAILVLLFDDCSNAIKLCRAKYNISKGCFLALGFVSDPCPSEQQHTVTASSKHRETLHYLTTHSTMLMNGSRILQHVEMTFDTDIKVSSSSETRKT